MLLTAEGLALVVLAVLLAGPVPTALARARWPSRAPRAALALWQAVGLGGGLAILGAGLTLAVSGLHRSWLRGVAALPSHLSGRLGPLDWAGVVLTLTAAAWLCFVLVTSTARLTQARRAHRRRLDLLADELEVGDLIPASGPALAMPPEFRVRLVDHPLAAAYCLPGVRPRVVLSQGLLDALSADQLTAVVTHEHAHARGQHDLVILPFRAWQQTFPFLPAARQALAAVELLVEMLADDEASRRCGPGLVLAALRRLAEATPGDPQITARAARLSAPPAPLSRSASAALYAGAATLVLLPPLVLLAS
jgi:Zn-dependent protease with chaperone function